ncbi:Hydantoin racemase [Peptoniphilus sp. ING2-D1G]|nr:Hydantoin racemase [Peptoniphilus sp. ING2-D1G]
MLIINPNSDGEMTLKIKEVVKSFKTEFIEVDVVGMEKTPKLVFSKQTIKATYEEVSETILKNKENYEIFILACHLDPNLYELRKLTNKIILGIGECSVLFSKMLGKTFSIIGSSDKTIELKKDMVDRYGALDGLKDVGYPEKENGEDLKRALLKASLNSMDKYNSDSIVLGCAGFVGVDAFIESNLKKDVFDGIIVALMIAENYAKYKEYKESLSFK